MPIDIVIYAVVAAGMVFWLRNVIGTRHGEERERPNPYDRQEPADSHPAPDVLPDGDDPVKRLSDTLMKNDNDRAEAGLVQIALADKRFNVTEFRENATDAFSMIVTAFADGDRETLRDLCSRDVYDAFDLALNDRQIKGEKIHTEIHSVRKADIVDAGIDNKKTAYVTIRFTADETYVIEDAQGNIIAGHPDRVTEMTDLWTFSREIRSSDPRWFLSKTEDDVVEAEGKTPLPDAG